MSLEIERKFLVKGDFKSHSHSSEIIKQGYISTIPERSVRIRIQGEIAFLTIKGIGNKSGTSRLEWEKEISIDDAEILLQICEPGMIEKTRYLINFREHTFEVDEFHGYNNGLVVAEVELEDENEEIILPDWIGKEVTGDEKYYNIMLMKFPYSTWERDF
ncbi:MAG: CYTH domain-containing protein [Saprospiraceae bacterium]